MSDLTKLKDAQAEVGELVINAGILGIGPSYYHGLLHERVLENTHERIREGCRFGDWQSFSWEQGWGVGCDLQVTWEDREVVKNGKKVKQCYPVCKVSWSSTGRSPLEARAAILLYSAVTDLATVIETHFASRDVETKEASFEREWKVRQKRRDAEIEEFKKTLKNGQEFNFEEVTTKDVPHELWENLHSCCAHKSKSSGEKCGSPTKTIVWSEGKQIFRPRCGRHKNSGLTEHDLRPDIEKAA